MRKIQTTLTAMMLWCPALAGFAQGTAFTYQGRLNDGANPASGSYDLTFALFDSSSGGAQQGNTVTNAATSVSNGLFTVTLDFGAGVFNGANRWLQIAARTHGVGGFATLSPRQQLTSTPYAIQSANALNAAVAATASSVSAANVSGVLSAAQLPPSVLTNGASSVNLTGTFSGNGAGVTNLSLYSLNSFGALNVLVQSNTFALASRPAAGGMPYQVVASDVNGDGRPDLVVGQGTSRAAIVLTNSSGGIFGSNATYNLGVGFFPVVVADVNGDGKPDLIGADYQTNLLTVLTNNGNGSFKTNAIYTISNPTFSVAAADVNGDGKVDLIYSSGEGGTLGVLTNNGTGSFGSNATYSVSVPFVVVAADFNADGKPDLICANNSTNTLAVLTNNGVGGFAAAPSIVVSNAPTFLTVADFNGDGRPDLICTHNAGYDGSIVLTNNGSGGFGLVGPVPTELALTYTPVDLNGDGKLDLICPNFTNNTLTLLTNNGSGGFVLFSKIVVGNAPLSAAATDVNGDGKLDLICGNLFDSTLSVLTNGNVFSVNFTGADFSGNNFSGGNFTGGNFTGGGSGLTDLDASQLTRGTVPNQRISGFYNETVTFFNSTNTFKGTFIGNGFDISSLNASALQIGTVPGAVLTGNYFQPIGFLNFNNAYWGGFTGNGGGLTNLSASQLTGGTLPDARLSTNVSLLGPGIDSSEITDGAIMNADINTAAGIVDTKLATISTAGKVGDSALSANVALRSGGNNFSGHQAVTNGNVGIGVTTPSFPLSFPSAVGDKISLYGTSGNHYGLGIQGFQMQLHTDSSAADVVFGYGQSTNLTETMRIKGNGNVGIATASPGKMLQLGGPANTEAMIRLNSTAADGVAGRAWDVGVPKSDTSTAGKFFSFSVQDTAATLPAFLVRWDTGNIGLYNTNPIALLTVGNAGSPAYCNGTTWVNGSDRNAKQDFAAVDGAEVLARVVSLPVQRWSYKAQPTEKHIGPMAQDFHAAFGLNGRDDTHIATVDEAGVALAAIQGLNQKLTDELKRRDAENAKLQERLEKLERMFNQRLNRGAE